MPRRRPAGPIYAPPLPALDFDHQINRGLVGYWPLSETGGLIAREISGNRTNGALTSGQSFGPGYRFGRAAKFVAASSQVINVTANAALQPATAVTVSCWVNFTAFNGGSGWQGLVRYEDLPDNEESYALDCDNNGLRWLIRGSGGTYIGAQPASNLQVVAGQWCMVTGTWKVGTASLYVNGQFLSSNDVTNGTVNSIFYTGTLLDFGFQKAAGTYLGGALSGVRIWDRALLPSEVASLYEMPLLGVVPPARRRFIPAVPVATSRPFVISW